LLLNKLFREFFMTILWAGIQNFNISRFALVLFVSISGFSSISQANPVRATWVFERLFYSEAYVYNLCGQNAYRLLEQLSQQGIDLRDTYAIQITNSGYSNFGRVRAYEVRESGALIRPGQTDVSRGRLQNHPGPRSWEFHVVVEHDGFIFDFDFQNAPTILETDQYLDRNFGPSTSDRKDYNFYRIPAFDYLRNFLNE